MATSSTTLTMAEQLVSDAVLHLACG